MILLTGLVACAPGPVVIPETGDAQSAAEGSSDDPMASQSAPGAPTPMATDVTSPAPTTETPVASENPPETQDPLTTSTPSVASENPPESQEPQTTSTPSVTDPPAALYAPGDTGDDVRDLQHRLMQLEWYSGRITEKFGEQTRLAVEGFQAKRGLPVLGFVDEATWDRLGEMTRNPTRDEMYNVLTPGPALLASGANGDAVKDLQARLRQVAWYSHLVDGAYGPLTVEAVKGFQGKREIPVTGEVDQRTKDRLHAMTRKPTADELNNIVPTPKPEGMVLDDRCLNGRVVCISKAQRKLAWVVDGEVKLTMDVRFGSELTPTRNGAFSVYWKSRNHVSKLYKSPMPYALFFSGGQAVHFSADFAARGYNGSSHGCVNVRNKDAVIALFDATQEGDTVIVYPG